MGSIIDGKQIAIKYQNEIIELVKNRIDRGLRVPCLATIIVGDDGGSIYYVTNQNRLCNKLGIEHKIFRLNQNVSRDEILKLISELNNDVNVDGIILQVPLPVYLDEKEITSSISYKKDVDGLTDVNTGKFYIGDKCFIPCTPKSVIELIKSTGVSINGMNAVVLGRSNIVGRPVFQLLLNENATVTICHSKTKNIKDVCSKADILVSAIGKPNFVDSSFIKDGAIVIDVGTTMVKGKVCGDVNFDESKGKAAFITPVPGGVGSMTTTMLLKNTCEAVDTNGY